MLADEIFFNIMVLVAIGIIARHLVEPVKYLLGLTDNEDNKKH